MDQVRKTLPSVAVGYVSRNELVDIRWIQGSACGEASDQTFFTGSLWPVEAHHGTAYVISNWTWLQAYGSPTAQFAEV